MPYALRRRLRPAAVVLVALVASVTRLAAQTSPYAFSPVAIGGGGYITNIVAHPTEPDLRYIRTDVGGCYRWDPEQERWVQLMDFLTPADVELSNVDGIALAATDPDVVYIAAGNAKVEGAVNGVLKSTDRGTTWQKTSFAVDQAFEGNQRDVRYIGERIAVDPLNARYVYAGTKLDGLYRSTDAGDTWRQNGQIPGGSVNSAADAKVVELDD